MIDLSRQQIVAERAGRYGEAASYITEYNTLISIHNGQVDQTNAALAKLRELL